MAEILTGNHLQLPFYMQKIHVIWLELFRDNRKLLGQSQLAPRP